MGNSSGRLVSNANILSDKTADDGKFVELRGNRFQKRECHQTSVLFSLPEEILLFIFESLSIPDTITMATTCKAMAQFISRNFVFKLVPPLSSANQEKIDGRNVLSIISAYVITLPHIHWKEEYLKNIECIRLEKLQRLEFTFQNDFYSYGRDHSDGNCTNHLLFPPYFDILKHYLSKAKNLTHLHIAIDRSQQTSLMIDLISKNLPLLTNIVLKATHIHSDRILQEKDRVLLDITGEVQHQSAHLMPISLNELLRRLLRNSSIKSLELLLVCEKDYMEIDNEYLGMKYPLKIQSSHLEHLRIEQESLSYQIEDLTCPELRKFEHKFRRYPYGEQPGIRCLFHYQPFLENIDYTTIITDSCPKLETINGNDIKFMRSCMTDPNSHEEWNEKLRSMCDCPPPPPWIYR